MKSSFILILMLLPASLLAQGYWGYGLNGGLQGCGYDTEVGSEAQSYKDEIEELRKSITENEKLKNKKKQELNKAKANLRKYEKGLRTSFSADGYTFLKNHFDSSNRCSTYQGFEAVAQAVEEAESEVPVRANPTAPDSNEQPGTSPRNNKVEPAPKRPRGASNEYSLTGNSRLPAAEDDKSSTTSLKIENKYLKKEWGSVCDFSNNPAGKLKADVCTKRYLWISENAKVNQAECQTSVLNYPAEKAKVDLLTNEVDSLTEAIKAAKDSIKDNVKSYNDELKEARRQQIEEIKEGGVCLSCLGNTSGTFMTGEPNLGGLFGNTLMALAMYGGTRQVYGDISSGNARLGHATPMPMGSPLMAAAPFMMGAIGAGLGIGSFGCAGMAGGLGGMGGGLFGPYAALGGMGQIGGAFGTPLWALGSQMGGGAYLNGMTPWGLNGPWGLNAAGMLPQLMMGG
ncbi:MAG: hypothetical protein L6Q37_02800, partial [Bdellovibrionaceae bacterium]|nr:hypothetical protein [Pseudobdellovibrionaceae bacterium]